jgi:3'-phosphoadenosine 5'-phosphosulfate (PAPS) 3'-phosphatase
VHPVPYLKEWDTCAPEAILREAGGQVADCLGEPLRYNKPDPRQPHGIVACGPG